MRVLQAGLAKSGNYWLYSIIRRLQEAAGRSPRGWIVRHPIQAEARRWNLSFGGQHLIDVLDIEADGLYGRISSRFRERIENEEEYFSKVAHVWTHSEVTERTGEVLDRFDRIVYVLRDPRDVAVSMSRFLFTPYMRKFYPHRWPSPTVYLVATLGRRASMWRRHVSGYLSKVRAHSIHVVAYEAMRVHPVREIARLAAYLDVDITEEEIHRIAKGTSLPVMRRSQRGSHVRRGEVFGWRDVVGRAQNLRVLLHAAELMDALGYPLTRHDAELCTEGSIMPQPSEALARLGGPPREGAVLGGNVRTVLRRLRR